ncbi:MAG: hypothetical protein KGO50_03470 [Myxococcales bacterium]|nr:hypothetical protein [Myxococcales bacterium]
MASLVVLALVACSDDPTTPTDTADTGALPDVADADGSAVAPDADLPDSQTPDSGTPDVAPDALPNDIGDDAASDADPVDESDTTSETDATDGSTADAGDLDTEDVEPDVPTTPPLVDCTTDPGLCDLPYSCIAGTCRIPIERRNVVEDAEDFTVTEPEELTNIFNLLKSLAFGARFLLIAPADGDDSAAVTAEYGAADVIDESGEPVTVAWQFFARNEIVFRPDETGEGTPDPRAWISDEFLYDLTANVIIDLGIGDPIAASIGFNAEQVRFRIVLDESGLGGDGSVVGYLTRAEAEARPINDVDTFAAFRALLCTNPAFPNPADGIWHLSDILDCNDTPIDHDLDGDGTNDSYFLRIDVGFVAASIVEL